MDLASPQAHAQRDGGSLRRVGGVVTAAAGSTALVLLLGERAIALATAHRGWLSDPPTAVAVLGVDEVVEVAAVLAGLVIAGWFAVSLWAAAVCAVARATGRRWVAGERVIARMAPTVARRALAASAGTSLAVTGACLPVVAADREPVPAPTLGWSATVSDAPLAPTADPTAAAVPPAVSTTPAPHGTSTSPGPVVGPQRLGRGADAEDPAPVARPSGRADPFVPLSGENADADASVVPDSPAGVAAATGAAPPQPRPPTEPWPPGTRDAGNDSALPGAAPVTSTTGAAADPAPAVEERARSVGGPAAAGSAPSSADPDPSGGSPAGGTAVPEPTPPVVDHVTVRPGDTLWSIAAEHLPASADVGDIAAAWPAWYEANVDVVGTDPDLIHPGQELVPPATTRATSDGAAR